MLTLGCDPGVSGAYAVLAPTGELLALDDLPIVRDRSSAWIDASVLLPRLLEVKAGRPMAAIVERQQAMPFGLRGRKQGASSTFTTGCAFGALLATLQAAGCSIEFVTAATWKARAGLGSDKSESLDRARLLYPGAALDRKKDHGRAEALLIARDALTRAHRDAA